MPPIPEDNQGSGSNSDNDREKNDPDEEGKANVAVGAADVHSNNGSFGAPPNMIRTDQEAEEDNLVGNDDVDSLLNTPLSNSD